jgi:hypothetical protein
VIAHCETLPTEDDTFRISHVSNGEIELAVVKRVDDDSLGYVNVEGSSLSFTAETIENYRGQAFEDLGIKEGATVSFIRNDEGIITAIFPPPEAKESIEGSGGMVSRGLFESPQAEDLPPKFNRPVSVGGQGELHPGAEPGDTIRPGRALPKKTRDFGKLIDTTHLQAGDLLLTRDASGSSWITEGIADVQNRIGYGPSDAQWIHAAMYLGDGANVVEATIDGLFAGGNVRITNLDDYCDGSNILRFRRSSFITQERQGWLVCIRALSRLGKPYSIGRALKAWWDVRVAGTVAYGPEQKNILSDGVVCSTLYADSFNRALRLSLGEDNGICVPAWFSATNDFVDVDARWLKIA